ncbi:MAG TPA: MarR family winged helix-turn-helix transcriptional regulator [Stellaceae bacterium]|jgi:DNA-binding MarR family transcriptional regulator
MSSVEGLPGEITRYVRDTCLCLHLQRAARAVARHFDEAMRPLELTSGQFSLLMSLNRRQPPTIGDVSRVLAMDRTTVTANLKPLQRRGLVEVTVGDGDRRRRCLGLTPAGRALLAAALPVWRREHAVVEGELAGADRLRADLRVLSGLGSELAPVASSAAGSRDSGVICRDLPPPGATA